MTKHVRRVITTLYESQAFPRELWDRFAAEAHRRGQTTIAALRHAIDLYLAERPETKS